MGRTEFQRSNIINHLADVFNYKSYLEIGVSNGDNCEKINIAKKDSVDIRPRYAHCKYKMTSDEFFNVIPANKMYDIIFIDGLHTGEQVKRDITNSLKHLNPNGSIVVHDCNPVTIERTDIKVSGNVWEAILDIRTNRNDLSVIVVDTDHGCGVIRHGTQKRFVIPQGYTTDYQLLSDYRKELLNLISVEEFLQLYT